MQLNEQNTNQKFVSYMFINIQFASEIKSKIVINMYYN